MKVLYTTNIPAPYSIDFFNELGKSCELTVLFERKNASDRESTWLSNPMINFNGIFLNGFNTSNDTSLSFNVLKHVNDKSYNIIIVGGYGTPTGMLSIVVLSLFNRRFFVNIDGSKVTKDLGLKRILKKQLISKAYAWLSPGKIPSKYLNSYSVENSKIYNYPFSSILEKDIIKQVLDKYEKEALKKQLGIKEQKILVSIGQFIYRKGFDVLINSAAKISKDIGVYIIGGVPTEEYLKLIKQNNIENVHFIGFNEKEELKKYFLVSDLFVLPTREDIWGLVINEAMAYGLPIITTDRCTAGLELIEDYVNGFIVPVENSNALAEKINLIMEDKELRIRMSIENLTKIKDYTVEKMAKRHLEIFYTFLLNR